MYQDNLKISVILSIYGNDGDLLRMLNCISAQTKIPDELLIINSLESTEVLKIIDQFQGILNINYFFSNKRLLPGGSRNLGILKSTFPLIAFLDSKTFPIKSWLQDSIQQLNLSNASVIYGKTQYQAKTEIQHIFILSTYGKKPVSSVPGTVLLKDIIEGIGEFNSHVRAGEDLEWKDRINNNKTIKVQHSLKVNMLYDNMSENVFQEFFRSARNSWAASSINAQLNTRILIFGLTCLSFLMIVPNWNRFLGGLIFLPNITKIYFMILTILLVGIYLIKPKIIKYFLQIFSLPLIVTIFILQETNPAVFSMTINEEIRNLNYLFFGGLLIISFIFRAFIAPIRLGAKWDELMPIRWVYMGFFGLINDLVKVPGYFLGAILSLKSIVSK